jgi:hypothetical protein
MVLKQLRHFDPGLSRLPLTQPNWSLKNCRAPIVADVKLVTLFFTDIL